ncbi:MAG TPA: hypothetical protein VFE54_10500 [Mucilaginibacter sp.]|nr:hypothetical protein [Mucilaginibacter sp.]
MEEKELQDELSSIRSLMERSSKFISLSGLSGILAGVYALIGAGVFYKLLDNANSDSYFFLNGVRAKLPDHQMPTFSRYIIDTTLIWELVAVGIIVLLASIITAVLLSSRQAKRKGQPMWGSVSRSLLFHMITPLISGGALIFILLYWGHHNFITFYVGLIVPVMLIFYGLALVSASNFTFGEVKYLGLLEIALGLICACLPGYGLNLLFWALGFGVLHIIYGSMMYFKYDK